MTRKGIVLDRHSDVPLHRQLEHALREAILSGDLRPGERVLSSRELRTHLGLSRNTIISALGQLQAEGFIVTVRGGGTFVADVLQNHITAIKEDRQHWQSDLVVTTAGARFLENHALAANMDVAVPFRPGIPALDLFPVIQFKPGLSAACRAGKTLDYPTSFGDERLREAIARRLHQTRGVACAPDQVMITAGAQAAFCLIGRVMLDRNDVVAVEEPGYPNVRAAFAAEGARLFLAPVDDYGITLERIPKGQTRLIHTTPSHQYPLGTIIPLDRRLALLRWVNKHNAWVIEDDYDSEFNYTGKAQPALHSLDEEGRVFYVGTFSKSLAPGLRIAYLVVPRPLIAAFGAAQQVLGGHPSFIVQSALATFIEKGHFGRHIAKMRKVYDERRRFTAAEFRRVFGSLATIRDSLAGLHFIIELPREVNDSQFEKCASEMGIVVPALSSYYQGKPTLNGLVIGYAVSSTTRAREAIGMLAPLLDARPYARRSVG